MQRGRHQEMHVCNITEVHNVNKELTLAQHFAGNLIRFSKTHFEEINILQVPIIFQ